MLLPAIDAYTPVIPYGVVGHGFIVGKSLHHIKVDINFVTLRFARPFPGHRQPQCRTLGELSWGVKKSQARDKALASIQNLQESIRVAQLTPQVGIQYGRIRPALESCGQPIGNNDLRIAAHARAEGWILVTNNEREFCRVEGLQVENWVTA
ncbi:MULTISPECIES: PIN domain-containing protein [Acidithiobacillus]|jgi:tRNA(fMet)-specific endonuclease VapC|nr:MULTISPECIES: PIN domain-containing protein [Acidithiobacillus]MDA8176277.1 PIN domain-containing protein [Acidithiobacillus sp.]